MKVASKPTLSPGRIEKFPPTLMMRFFRSNVGSKSRGRSRSSPMFVRKKNAVIETQEPSSPKVTCIGQVRARRSSKGSNSGQSRTPPVNCPSCSLPKYWFCKPRKPKLGCFRPVWRKWVSFFPFGYCKKVNVRHVSSKVESNRRIHYKDSEETEENDDEDEEGHGELVPDVFISSTPPKNAFLLTRCRSAPYRSSSLACRFLGSPQRNSETEEDGDKAKESFDFEVGEREEGPKSLLSEPNSRNSVAESRTDQESAENLGIRKHFEGFINGINCEADFTERDAALPLILTRCKSEPAKTGERLVNPENHHFLEPNKNDRGDVFTWENN